MASINLELEYWKIGVAFAGMIVVGFIPHVFGWRTAKRLNISNATLEEIKDRATFRLILMKQVKEQSDRISELTREVADLQQAKLKGNLREITLAALVQNYEVRLKACEERQAMHELLCTPKTIEGSL